MLKKLLGTGKQGEQGLNNIDFSNTLTFFCLHRYLSLSNTYGWEPPMHISSVELTAGAGLYWRHCAFHTPPLRGDPNRIWCCVCKYRKAFVF